MSVSRTVVTQPAPFAVSTMRARQRPRLVGGLQEGARADLDVEHQRLKPRGKLLGQDRRTDQVEAFDRRGHVAHRVKTPVGGRDLGTGTDDGAAGLLHHAAKLRLGRGGLVARESPRACRACRRYAQVPDPRSSARRRRRPQARVPAPARRSRPRPPWNACPPPAPADPISARGPNRASPASVRRGHPRTVPAGRRPWRRPPPAPPRPTRRPVPPRTIAAPRATVPRPAAGRR